MRKAVWALPLFLLAGCATPAEEAARQDGYIAQAAQRLATEQGNYDAAVARKAAAVAEQEAWNVHTLGIPASGWAVLTALAIVLGSILLGVLIYRVDQALKHRRTQATKRFEARAEVAKTLRTCPTCHYEPTLDDRMRAAEDKLGSS